MQLKKETFYIGGIILLFILAACYWYYDTYKRDYWYSYNPLPLDRKIVDKGLKNQLDAQYETKIDSTLLTWYTTQKNTQTDEDLIPFCTHNSYGWVDNRNMYINYVFFVCSDIKDYDIDTFLSDNDGYRNLNTIGEELLAITYLNKENNSILAVDFPISEGLYNALCYYTSKRAYGVCGVPITRQWNKISSYYASKGIQLENLEPHIYPQ